MQNTFSDSDQISVGSSFATLVNSTFHGNMNAICWHRKLLGDFKEIVSKLDLIENITEISIEDLSALQLSEQGHIARETILNDIQLLSDFGASPSLNLLKNYERDDEFDFISTDVYSFHVDRAPIETNTFLCTYYGPASDILPNNQVDQKTRIPSIREKLKEIYEGTEDEFEAF